MIPSPTASALIYGQSGTQNLPIGCLPGVQAFGTLTSNNTNVSAGATVTIGSVVYTFATALTPTEGQVLIGADADTSLLNLINAINASGAKINGIDYYTLRLSGHPQVTAATSVTSHAFIITAIDAGTAGNAIATTETSATLSFGTATLIGGTNAALSVSPMAGEYETVAASQTAQVLGATGATGDFIAGVLIIPATTTPGLVTLLDGSTSIPLMVTGLTVTGTPIYVPLGMTSVSGAWKITTGANVSVIAIGSFT